jgi:7-cyano-7-deazaguanine synthase
MGEMSNAIANPRVDRLALPERLAILVSGGLDSAILLAEAVVAGCRVYPLYVRTGLYWETVEQQYLGRFLDAVAGPRLEPLHVLHLPVNDVYGMHWSLTGEQVPDDHSADEAVFLPGRNLLLLAKSLLWCHLQGIPAIALAPLGSNPFPDATPCFFAALQAVANQAVNGHVQILRPYADQHKEDVLRRGATFPLQHTFSCIRPVRGLHCGNCNKCAERRLGFRAAGIADPTDYASPT